jgi:FMN-dependent NADH-azoreductase
MYNLGIASQLKAWFDRIVVAGRTFRYTAAGPEGLAGPKKVIVVSARGGDYAPGTPGAAADFQEPYLKSLFAFIGVDDVTVVRAEGVAMGPERRQAAIEEALASGRAAAGALARAA